MDTNIKLLIILGVIISFVLSCYYSFRLITIGHRATDEDWIIPKNPATWIVLFIVFSILNELFVIP